MHRKILVGFLFLSTSLHAMDKESKDQRSASCCSPTAVLQQAGKFVLAAVLQQMERPFQPPDKQTTECQRDAEQLEKKKKE